MTKPYSDMAIIGGTGFETVPSFVEADRKCCRTPYGSTSSDLVFGKIDDVPIIFLSRHGEDHSIAPHNINYRANLYALKQNGVKSIVSIAAVGGIRDAAEPGSIVIPDQIIDYTWGRDHTFYDGNNKLHSEIPSVLDHVDFTYPHDRDLLHKAKSGANSLNIQYLTPATYGVTQGPRLESAAEIKRMERDGCDVVGMTAMPEAGLARELSIRYLTLAMVVNYAAGKTSELITMDIIRQNLDIASEKVMRLLGSIIASD